MVRPKEGVFGYNAKGMESISVKVTWRGVLSFGLALILWVFFCIFFTLDIGAVRAMLPKGYGLENLLGYIHVLGILGSAFVLLWFAAEVFPQVSSHHGRMSLGSGKKKALSLLITFYLLSIVLASYSGGDMATLFYILLLVAGFMSLPAVFFAFLFSPIVQTSNASEVEKRNIRRRLDVFIPIMYGLVPLCALLSKNIGMDDQSSNVIYILGGLGIIGAIFLRTTRYKDEYVFLEVKEQVGTDM